MWTLFEIGVAVVFVLVPAVLVAGIFRQAGYSRLWGVLMLIPVANIIVLCVFACKEWPISRELGRRRLGDGEGTSEDAKSVLYQAMEFENRGDKQRALDLYQLVADSGKGEAAEEAAHCIQLTNETPPSANRPTATIGGTPSVPRVRRRCVRDAVYHEPKEP